MSIGSELLRFDDRKVLLFDFETQRLTLIEDNLVWDAAWVVADKWGKVLERHQYYLKWPPSFHDRMSPDAARITRFQRSWVDNGTDPEFVLDAFESYLLDDRYIVSGHQVMQFDLMLWQLWREALGRKRDYNPLSRVVDTNLLARAYKEGWKPDRSNLYAWQLKVANGFRKGVKTNLTLMATELGVTVDEGKTHGASYDLEINAAVYSKLVNLVEI